MKVKHLLKGLLNNRVSRRNRLSKMLPYAHRQAFPSYVHRSAFPAVGNFVISISKWKQISKNYSKKYVWYFLKTSVHLWNDHFTMQYTVAYIHVQYYMNSETLLQGVGRGNRGRLFKLYFKDHKIMEDQAFNVCTLFHSKCRKKRDTRLKSHSKFFACIPGNEQLLAFVNVIAPHITTHSIFFHHYNVNIHMLYMICY